MAILLSATRTDPDLWGHVRFGLDWLATWQLPSTDPYSFTQDRQWINHEWLSEMLMGVAYRSLGAAGLVTMKMVVVAGAMFCLWRRLAGASPLIVAATITVAATSALPVTATVRPQIWSLLALCLLMPMLTFQAPSYRQVATSAVLFALWANLHGGWITGAAVLMVHVAIRLIRSPQLAPRFLLLAGACVSATLLNPYGFGLWKFLASTVRTSRPDISEWAPFSLREPPIMWLSIVVSAASLAVLILRRPLRREIETVAVVVVLIVAGLRVSRVAPLMCPAILTLVAPFVRELWGTKWRLTARSNAGALVLLAPLMLTPIGAVQPVRAVLSCLPTNDTWAPDTQTAGSLVGASGRLWTTFDWGQYALWHFAPALRVSIDGRRETVYSDDVVTWNRAVEYGSQLAIDRMAALAPEYVWLPASRQTARRAILEKGYRVDAESTRAFVLTRKDLPRLSTEHQILSSCFP